MVNLDFVLNVVEDPTERVETVLDAWHHIAGPTGKRNTPPKQGVGPRMLSKAGANVYQTGGPSKAWRTGWARFKAPPKVTGKVEPTARIPDLASMGMSGIPHGVIHRFPNPWGVAAKKALSERPPASMERVLRQIEAARELFADWRDNGLPDQPHFLRPPLLQ